MIPIFALILAAAPPLLAEPELPACAARIAADPTACDAAIAAEKDGGVKARLLLARAYQHNEKYDHEAALRDLDAAIAADPRFGLAWHERSYTYGELRDFPRAVADSDQDVKLRPNEADAYRERAFARHGLGDLKGAWEDRAKVVALEPKSAGALVARGEAALWLGRFDDARADAAAALTMAEAAGDADAAAAAKALQKDISLRTTRSGAASPAAACVAAQKQGRFESQTVIGDCTAAFLAAASGREKADMLTTRSMALLVAAQDRAGSVADQVVAVALDPGNADWHANLGGSYVQVHHSWAGKRELDIAIRLKDSWPARAERAAARYNLRDFDGAFADAKKSFEMHPNDVALTVLGDLSHDRGDDKSAKLYWMAAWHLGDRDDGLRERLKGIGIAEPDKESKN
jgi:tetratricopeptide (TPR) repeat protein